MTGCLGLLLYTYTSGWGINKLKNKTKDQNFMNNQKQKTSINFKKAHSLLGKIIKMAEENRYCIDIMQQNLAVIGLLRSSHQMLMENHLNTCFKTAMAARNERKKQNMIQEILKVAKLFNK